MDRVLVDVGAPTGPGRHDRVAILKDRRKSHQIILPQHVVDIDFHGAEVAHGGAKIGAKSVLLEGAETMATSTDVSIDGRLPFEPSAR